MEAGGLARLGGSGRAFRKPCQAQLLEGATVVAVAVEDVVLGAVALRDAVAPGHNGLQVFCCWRGLNFPKWLELQVCCKLVSSKL